MKDTKRTYGSWLFYDPQGLERTFEAMALKGWKVKKLNNWYIEYEAIEPQPLRYTVTYFDQASQFRPTPTDDQQVFLDYCRESGWDLVATWTQMLIFCASLGSATPIDTDPEQQLYAMDRAMRKGLLPTALVQIFSTLLMVVVQFYSVWTMPAPFYSTPSSVLLMPLLWLILCHQIYTPLAYLRWHRRAKRAVDLGVDIPSPRFHPRCNQLLSLLFLLCGLAFLVLCVLSLGLNTTTLVYGLILLVLIPVFFLINKLQKRGLLAKIRYRVLFVALTTVVSTALLFSLTLLLISLGVMTTQAPTLESPLPLTIAQFTTLDEGNYTSDNRVQNSPLLTWQDCYQRPSDHTMPSLSYQVYQTDFFFVYHHILTDLMSINANERNLDPQYRTNWRLVDLPEITAAYQCYQGDTPQNGDYILCTPTAIVQIRFDSDLTAQQISQAIALLAKTV